MWNAFWSVLFLNINYRAIIPTYYIATWYKQGIHKNIRKILLIETDMITGVNCKDSFVIAKTSSLSPALVTLKFEYPCLFPLHRTPSFFQFLLIFSHLEVSSLRSCLWPLKLRCLLSSQFSWYIIFTSLFIYVMEWFCFVFHLLYHCVKVGTESVQNCISKHW